MFENDQDGTGTQDDGSQLDDEGGAQGGTGSDDEGGEGSGDGSGYFLTVNDRTKYKTQQDAVKGYNEASQRIAQLSPWEKEVSQAFGGLTPQQAKGIINEYVRMKQAERAANGSAAKNGNSPTDSAKELTKDQKEVVAFLKENGFITKEEAADLRKQIEELKTGTTALRESRESDQLASLVDIGRSTLRSALEGAKIPLERASRFESAIKGWIDEDDERVNRFYAGGDETKKLITEGFQAICKEFGISLQSKPNLTAAQNKNKVLNRNPRPLPQSGSGQGNNRPQKEKQNEGLTPDVHRRAAALFEQIRDGGGE